MNLSSGEVMVRYSDIIKKNVIKKKTEADKRDPAYLVNMEDGMDAIQFGILDKGSASPEGSTPAKEARLFMRELLDANMGYLKNLEEKIRRNEHFDIDVAETMVDRIIDAPDIIEKYSPLLPSKKGQYDVEGDYMMLHSGVVALYALKIGTGLNYSRKQLRELALSAFFYDIGLYQIPEEIIGKKGALNDSEIGIVRRHTEIGGNMLVRFEKRYPLMARVAYEHHEREQGQGYPAGLQGNEICEYAKIVGMADKFIAMIHNRPYREAILRHVSIRSLIDEKNVLFPAKLIKVFIDKIGVFPVGSYVRLNNTAIGKVIENNRHHPLKPLIKLVVNSHGKPVPGRVIIDLVENPVLHVKGVIDDKDISVQ